MDLAGRDAGALGEHAPVRHAAGVASYWTHAAAVGIGRFRHQDPGRSQQDPRWRDHPGPGDYCGPIVDLCGNVAVGADHRQDDELPTAVGAAVVARARSGIPARGQVHRLIDNRGRRRDQAHR